MDPEMPWITLKPIMNHMFHEKAQSKDETEKMTTPGMKIFFLPTISASLPKGTENAATVSIYAVITHPRNPALTSNSSPIAGMERFRALPINVVEKVVTMVTNIMDFWLFVMTSYALVCPDSSRTSCCFRS